MSAPELPVSKGIDRQREHQANERTFLAWVRTSITLISFGFVIARFGLFLCSLGLMLGEGRIAVPGWLNSQTEGALLLVAGISCLLIGTWRYDRAFLQIEAGDYRPGRRWAWIFTFGLIVLGVLLLPFIFSSVPTVGEHPAPESKGRLLPHPDL